MDYNLETLANRSILVFEDTSCANFELTTALRHETGLDVSGFSGLDAAPWNENPAIIIADLNVLGKPEAVDQLRFRYSAPVIILSERPSLALAVRVMRAGACDFFPKPVSVSALSERVLGLLQQRPASSVTTSSSQGTNGAIAPFWEQERIIIETALSACNGNISKAAAALQISPSTIYRKKQSWDTL